MMHAAPQQHCFHKHQGCCGSPPVPEPSHHLLLGELLTLLLLDCISVSSALAAA